MFNVGDEVEYFGEFYKKGRGIIVERPASYQGRTTDAFYVKFKENGLAFYCLCKNLKPVKRTMVYYKKEVK